MLIMSYYDRTQIMLLKQIVLNQAAFLACELEKEHSDEVKKLCKLAFDASSSIFREVTDG